MSTSIHFINYAQLASLGEKKHTVQLRSEKSNFIETEKSTQNKTETFQIIKKNEKNEQDKQNEQNERNYINESLIVNTEGLGFY